MGFIQVYFSSLLSALLFIFSSPVYGTENPSTACMACHQETLTDASSSSFSHMIERIGCTKCHNESKNRFDNETRTVATQNIMKDAIISLGSLPPDKGKKYEVKIEATAPDGNKAEPVVIDAGNQMIWNRPAGSFNISRIFDIKVEKIKRGIFSTAVISWLTNVPANCAIEYSTPGKRMEKLSSSGEVFSRRHKAVLQGIRNNSKYSFRVTSRDLNGNTIRSEKFIFDTSGNLDLQAEPGGITAEAPGISKPMFFRIGKKDDIFLRVSADKAVNFRISLTKVEKGKNSACGGSKPTLFSTIEVCRTCHPQDASHPVGVRSTNPKVTVPDELPTIDNGIITCVTCHEPHGGRRSYLLRVEFSKEICVKCHPKY